MSLSWCFYAPRWISRLPVDLGGSLTATTLLRCSRTSKPPGQSRGWRAAIRMVCFTLLLTVTLTLCCCSVPVSAACVWRRPLSAYVMAGTPAGVWPTQLQITLRRHLRRSWIPLTDKTLPKLSLHRQNRVWGSHLLDSRRSYYMINVWLVSPSEHGFLTSFTWFASCWGWLFESESE